MYYFSIRDLTFNHYKLINKLLYEEKFTFFNVICFHHFL